MNYRVLLGKQTGKGVKATEYKELFATTSGLAFAIKHLQSEALTGTDLVEDAFAKFESGQGDVTQEISREAFEYLMNIAGFAVNETVPGDYHIPQTADFDSYATIIVENTDANVATTYTDCLINTLKVDLATDAYVKVSAGILSASIPEVTEVGSVTVTEFTDKSKLFTAQGRIGINLEGQDISGKVEGANIDINNNLQSKKAINDTMVIKKGGKREVNVTINLNEFDGAEYRDAISKVNEASTAVFTLGTGVVGEDVTIEFPKLKYKEVTPGDMEGMGTLTKGMMALSDGNTNMKVKFTKS